MVRIKLRSDVWYTEEFNFATIRLFKYKFRKVDFHIANTALERLQHDVTFWHDKLEKFIEERKQDGNRG